MQHLIFIGCFLLGGFAGFVMHRSDFCMAGMFRDLFLFRSGAMLRVMVLLVVVSMICFELVRLSGLAQVPFAYFGTPSLINPFGGVAFGIGMVLAGGCAVGTLYKMGAGSLPSLFAFGGLLIGSVLYAEIYPWWVPFSRSFQLSSLVTLPQMLGVSPSLLVSLTTAMAVIFLWRWFRADQMNLAAFAEGYLQPWKAALWLALLSVGSVLLVGLPFGVTTAYARMGGFLESLLFPQHVAGLTYFMAKPILVYPPVFESFYREGLPQVDLVLLIQFPVILGIILGSAFSAARLREWKFSAKVPLKQCVWAMFGGILMGLSARMAPACNVWHLMGGAPIFAVQSLLFIGGLIPGAWIGSRILVRYVV